MLLSAAWLIITPLDPVETVNTAVAMLLLVSIAVIVWLPDRPAGIVMKAKNDPPLFAATMAGAVVTIEPPT